MQNVCLFVCAWLHPCDFGPESSHHPPPTNFGSKLVSETLSWVTQSKIEDICYILGYTYVHLMANLVHNTTKHNIILSKESSYLTLGTRLFQFTCVWMCVCVRVCVCLSLSLRERERVPRQLSSEGLYASYSWLHCYSWLH